MLPRDPRFDIKLIAVRGQGDDSIWDGQVRNLVYNTGTMEWESMTSSGGGSGSVGVLGEITATDIGIDVKALDVAIKEGAISGSVRTSGLNVAGKVTKVTLSTSGWTALPATPLADRNAIAIQNSSAQDVYINYDNSLALTTNLHIKIPPGAERQYDITDNILIYAFCTTSALEPKGAPGALAIA